MQVIISTNFIMKEDKWEVTEERFGIKRVSHMGLENTIAGYVLALHVQFTWV